MSSLLNTNYWFDEELHEGMMECQRHYAGDLLVSIDWSASVWWLQMAWCQIGTRPSATIMLTFLFSQITGLSLNICVIHLWTISQVISQSSITNICLKSTGPKFHSIFPGANELNLFMEASSILFINGGFVFLSPFSGSENLFYNHCTTQEYINKFYQHYAI